MSLFLARHQIDLAILFLATGMTSIAVGLLVDWVRRR